MELKIDSKVSYDVNVHIITETENIERKLKAEQTCQFSIQGKHAVLNFKECKSNILINAIENILVIILNYIYFCISYEDFSSMRLFVGITSCIKLTIDIPQDNQTYVNIHYMTDESLSKGSIDIGKVVSKQSVEYELDEDEFIKAEKQWIKESCLYMVPALLIIIIGIFIAVLKQKHILIAIMSILFIGLTGLICKFICEMNRKIEAHMSYLKYRLKTMSTSSNSRS